MTLREPCADLPVGVVLLGQSTTTNTSTARHIKLHRIVESHRGSSQKPEPIQPHNLPSSSHSPQSGVGCSHRRGTTARSPSRTAPHPPRQGPDGATPLLQGWGPHAACPPTADNSACHSQLGGGGCFTLHKLAFPMQRFLGFSPACGFFGRQNMKSAGCSGRG